MKRKLYGFFGISFIISIILYQALITNALTFPLIDEVDDVFHLINLNVVSRGDYYNEIDILEASIIEINLIITFQSAPIIDDEHSYGGYIYWWGPTNIFNYTSWRIGIDILEDEMTNYADIRIDYLLNDSDYNLRLYDVITIENNKIIFPILNHSLLPNFPNPPHFFFAGSYYISDDDFYVDHLPEILSWTPPSSNLTTDEGRILFPSSILTLISIIVIF
ncbi:MAG: hypothetical protein HZR80_02785 [Candidatus Heimdallarchaeota archaeon]